MIRYNKQLSALKFHLWGILIVFLLSLFFLNENDYIISFTMYLYIFLLSIPVIFLHVTYILHELKHKIIVDNYIIKYTKNKLDYESSFEKIIEIVERKSTSQNIGGIQYYPFESYYYSIITFSNGESIVITCFNDVDLILNIFDSSKIKKENSLLNFLPVVTSLQQTTN